MAPWFTIASGKLASLRARIRAVSPLSADILLLTGGSAAAQLIALSTLPLISRLYSPEQMGLFSTFVAVVAVVSPCLSLRYEFGIVSARSAQDAADLTAISLLLVVPGALACAVIAELLRIGRIAGAADAPPGFSLWLFPALVVTQVFGVLRFWFLREKLMRPLAAASVYQSVARAIAPIVLALVTRSWVGLAVGEVFGRAAGIGSMLRRLWRGIREHALQGFRSRAPALLRRFSDMPLYALPSTILNSLALNLPVPLVATAFGAGAAGQYALVHRVMQAPLALVGRSTADAFHSSISHLWRTEPHRMLQLFWSTAGLLAVVGLVPATLMAFLAGALFSVIFGSAWAEAGRLAIAIVPWSYAAFVVSPLSRAVQVVGGQRSKLVYDAASIGLVVLAISIARAKGYSLFGAVLLLSSLQVVAYAIYLLVLWRLIEVHASADAGEG